MGNLNKNLHFSHFYWGHLNSVYIYIYVRIYKDSRGPLCTSEPYKSSLKLGGLSLIRILPNSKKDLTYHPWVIKISPLLPSCWNIEITTYITRCYMDPCIPLICFWAAQPQNRKTPEQYSNAMANKEPATEAKRPQASYFRSKCWLSLLHFWSRNSLS